jgi:hypothetical protein
MGEPTAHRAGTSALLLLLSVVFSAHPATAHVVGGSIGGIVTDQQASALPGVSLTVSAPPVKKAVVTAGDGSYRLVDPVPATYVVTARLAGCATLVRRNVVVREGLNLTLDLRMTVGAINETVEVRADTPLLESRTAAQRLNISGDLQRALPLSALRTWADALTLVPGVTTSQARFQTYSLFGTAHPSGVVLIDGADATSVLQGSTLYSPFGRDTSSDIQVKTGLGAVLTAASQTGTDRFSGAAAYQYEPKD